MEAVGSRLGARPLALLLWILAAGLVGWTAARGFEGPDRRLDARPIVLAGHAWLSGESPYVSETYSRLWQAELHGPRPDAFVFAYPPNAALVLAPLALGGVSLGLVLLDVLNVACFALALFFCMRLAGDGVSPEWRSAARAGALALCASCGALSGTLLIGQTSLWVLAAVLWLWWSGPSAVPRALDVFAVALLAMKPSLTLPVLCFLAVLRPLPVVFAAALSLVTCVVVALWTDGGALPAEWLRALASYSATPANQPALLASAQHLFTGLPAPSLPAFGALMGAFLGFTARKAPRDSLDEPWLAVLALALACSPAHEYDLVLAAPLAAFLVRARPAAWPWYVAGVVAVARPAALARITARLGLGEAGELERLISALATVLLAGGTLVHVVSKTPWLRVP
ncbi:MAG TPA: glycosyltransferase family 87 protein, partial [Myxococcota bacterium]|nr:glycosyltransferase family 87 protein [Myxococcota bacterium]